MKSELSVRDIRDLTDAQLAALRHLKVSERQEILGKSFLESIEDWENERQAQVLGLCFLIDDQPVGLTLLKRPLRSQSRTVSIHGLKIATPWQHQGLGHRAFRLAVDYLKDVWLQAETLKLAVDAENGPAIVVYRAFGMKDSGPIFHGPNGKEHRMEISLTP